VALYDDEVQAVGKREFGDLLFEGFLQLGTDCAASSDGIRMKIRARKFMPSG